MIKINGLKFSYGKEAFLEVDELVFEDGTFTAVIGANGSGKTTLLKLIAGIERAGEGYVEIDGEKAKTLSSRELARRLSYFPQNRTVPDMEALEAVLLGRYPHSTRVLDSDRKAAQDALEITNAECFAHRRMKELSSGERQRVYLAMTLAQNSGNCLFDEPSNFLDSATVFEMLSVLQGLKEKGKCVICVFHDLSAAMEYADRIIIVSDGRIFDSGTPEEIYENKSIEAALGVSLFRFEKDGKNIYCTRPL